MQKMIKTTDGRAVDPKAIGTFTRAEAKYQTRLIGRDGSIIGEVRGPLHLVISGIQGGRRGGHMMGSTDLKTKTARDLVRERNDQIAAGPYKSDPICTGRGRQ